MTTLELAKARRSHDCIRRLSCYHPTTVPAVLETPGYARAVQAERRRGRPPAGLDAGVLDTIANQPGRPKVWAVLELLALRRTPGGDEAALHEQLRHLLDLINSQVLSLQIIPEVPARPPSAPFTLIRFARDDRLDAVILDPGRTAGRPRPAAPQYATLFTYLSGSASTPAESTRVLAAFAANSLP